MTWARCGFLAQVARYFVSGWLQGLQFRYHILTTIQPTWTGHAHLIALSTFPLTIKNGFAELTTSTTRLEASSLASPKKFFLESQQSNVVGISPDRWCCTGRISYLSLIPWLLYRYENCCFKLLESTRAKLCLTTSLGYTTSTVCQVRQAIALCGQFRIWFRCRRRRLSKSGKGSSHLSGRRRTEHFMD